MRQGLFVFAVILPDATIRYICVMASEREFWVFGYGSLMWKPGFAHAESGPALIRGFHRRLCVYSHVHRGTPDCPGLVMGLDRGGSCHGMAYRVEAANWQETLAYLRAREQVTSVYLEAVKPVSLMGSGRRVEALTYLVNRKHRQYAGNLSLQQLLSLVKQGEGISGRCTEYIANTLGHLRDMNIHDSRLEDLGAKLFAQAAESAG
jgi:cation transport protein ChaC